MDEFQLDTFPFLKFIFLPTSILIGGVLMKKKKKNI